MPVERRLAGPVPKIASTISVHCEISEKCSSQRLLVGDLDDGDAEAAEDVEVGARVAADVGERRR